MRASFKKRNNESLQGWKRFHDQCSRDDAPRSSLCGLCTVIVKMLFPR
jgi:hypothetical protein